MLKRLGSTYDGSSARCTSFFVDLAEKMKESKRNRPGTAGTHTEGETEKGLLLRLIGCQLKYTRALLIN